MSPSRIFALILAVLLPGIVTSQKAPYGGNVVVYCNSAVVAQMAAAWQADERGHLRGGTWEYGFRVDFAFGQIQVGELVPGDQMFHSLIPTNSDTIAIVHVHPLAAISQPSDLDMRGRHPTYVISQDGLFVTNPRTRTYRLLMSFSAMLSTDGCLRRSPRR